MPMTSNATLVAADIRGHGVKTGVAVQKVVAHHGMLLQAAVKRNASLPRSGPPGPRIITGDYNRSIYLKVAVLRSEVGTNKPQGRRLEFGFVGLDSLGRNYDQPPYPHFGPALDQIEPAFLAGLAAAAGDNW